VASRGAVVFPQHQHQTKTRHYTCVHVSCIVGHSFLCGEIYIATEVSNRTHQQYQCECAAQQQSAVRLRQHSFQSGKQICFPLAGPEALYSYSDRVDSLLEAYILYMYTLALCIIFVANTADQQLSSLHKKAPLLTSTTSEHFDVRSNISISSRYRCLVVSSGIVLSLRLKGQSSVPEWQALLPELHALPKRR